MASRNEYGAWSDIKEECRIGYYPHKDHGRFAHLISFEYEEGWWKSFGSDLKLRCALYNGNPQFRFGIEFLPIIGVEVHVLPVPSLHIQFTAFHFFIGGS